MTMKKQFKKLLACMLVFVLLLTAGCGGGKDEIPAEPLKETNQIPVDGIITKEQFKTVAGESMEIRFTAEADGNTYTWAFNAGLIKNPQDQNLKVTFENNVLDAVKGKAADAVNALKLNMTGKGLIVPGRLTIKIPALWEAESAFYAKEEKGAFTEICGVTVTKDESNQTTTLTMELVSMEETSYIIGTKASNENSGTDDSTVEDSVSTEDISQGTEETKTDETDSVDKTEKKPETTTKKEETTTSKKQETTTAKKEETTTAKKEETTTAKKEETTTEAPKLTCTISISCSTILDNMDKLDSAKKSFVPSSGWILKKTTVTFEEGESVHDVLKRVCKNKGIHMESSYTPIYDSAYIEGINQIYEFDCGSESGWMYKVNGWFPNYGCSQYKVSDGDNIAWVYTCDLGTDVRDNSMQ